MSTIASLSATQEFRYGDLRDMVSKRREDAAFSWDPRELAGLVPTGARILILLDKDGTLDRFVKDPTQAFVPGVTVEVLKRLADLPQVTLALASGRPVEDLKHLVGRIPITYYGHHGWERCRGNTDVYEMRLAPGAGFERRIDALEQRFCEKLKDRGVPVRDGDCLAYENKESRALAAHWRGRSRLESQIIEEAFREAVHESGLLGAYKLQPGDKVLELTPAGRTKGHALQELMQRGAYDYVLCIGDDKTDLNMMEARRQAGAAGMDLIVAKKIGLDGAYHVKSPVKLRVFLLALAQHLEQASRA